MALPPPKQRLSVSLPHPGLHRSEAQDTEPLSLEARPHPRRPPETPAPEIPPGSGQARPWPGDLGVPLLAGGRLHPP